MGAGIAAWHRSRADSGRHFGHRCTGPRGHSVDISGVSQSFAIITAHCQEGRAHEWGKYVNVDTLVVLMGVRNRDIVAAVANSCRPQPGRARGVCRPRNHTGEEIVESTLGEVAAGADRCSSSGRICDRRSSAAALSSLVADESQHSETLSARVIGSAIGCCCGWIWSRAHSESSGSATESD